MLYFCFALRTLEMWGEAEAGQKSRTTVLTHLALFGDKQRFAVQAEVDSSRSGSDYAFGHICLWAKEKRIGYYSEDVLLSVPVDFFQRFLSYEGVRSEAYLAAMTPTQLLSFLEQVLYGESADALTLHETAQKEKRYAPFLLCPGGGEAFDGCYAALVETLDHTRFIWRTEDYDDAQETLLRSGECETHLRAFVEWFSQIK